MGDPEAIRFTEWLHALPAPTVEPSTRAPNPDPWREQRATVRASVPSSYRWAFDDACADGYVERVNLPGWRLRLAALAERPWIIFAGVAGSGKTSLAVAALREAWEQRIGSMTEVAEFDLALAQRIAFVHAHRLGVARIQHRAGDGEAPEVSAAMRAPLLLLDDVGSERDTANNAVPDVIFERHAEGRDTWITTGLTVPQLKTRYGDGVTRRMLERALIVKLGGDQ